MINALCIDLEPWYSVELLKKYSIDIDATKDDQISESVSPILELLNKHKLKATFAVLGSVAEKHPELINYIYSCGHEIASHAYSHKTLSELGKTEFEIEIKKSTVVLQRITGVQPVTFRAPSFSINESTKWAFEILANYGFKYDASIFPIKTNLYGLSSAPLNIYKPSLKDIVKHDPDGKITEFPNPAIKIGINLPVTGGFYFRTLPLFYQRMAIKHINNSRAVLLYIHPWETYTQTPRLKNIPWFSRFVTYHGINKSMRNLEALLTTFDFAPIAYVLDMYSKQSK